MLRKIVPLALILMLTVLAACSQKSIKRSSLKETHLTSVGFDQLKHWQYDSQLDALEAFKRSCKAILNKNPEKPLSKLTDLGGSVKEWVPICKEASSGKIVTNLQARSFFENRFTPYKVTDSNGGNIGKFTGYYEIELHGSKVKTKEFQHPVYQCPDNLHHLKGKGHFTHAHINKGALKNKTLEIAYVNNQARLFFMHIQGSGVIKLPDGSEMKVGYAGQNGHSYKAIGPLMKNYCQEPLKSAVDIMEWLHKNPKIGKQIMEENPSYVFFRKIEGEGPVGGQGVPLTQERSIAVDAKLYPYSSPFWVETTTPKTGTFPSIPYNRLFIAQDTGGAIKGAIRGDVFYGRGVEAEQLAGFMNNNGSYYILLPKQLKVPAIYYSK